MGISLGALAGLPPSPLFASEVLIVAGGFQAGHPWARGATALLLALGFLGLAHALIETTAGNSPPPRARRRSPACAASPSLDARLRRPAARRSPRLRSWLPGSELVDALAPRALVTAPPH